MYILTGQQTDKQTGKLQPNTGTSELSKTQTHEGTYEQHTNEHHANQPANKQTDNE